MKKYKRSFLKNELGGIGTLPSKWFSNSIIQNEKLNRTLLKNIYRLLLF